MIVSLPDGAAFKIEETKITFISRNLTMLVFRIASQSFRLYLSRDEESWHAIQIGHAGLIDPCPFCWKSEGDYTFCEPLNAYTNQFASQLVKHKGVRLFCAARIKPRAF